MVLNMPFQQRNYWYLTVTQYLYLVGGALLSKLEQEISVEWKLTRKVFSPVILNLIQFFPTIRQWRMGAKLKILAAEF